MLTFSQYQQAARTTAKYPDVGHNLYYPTLGLSGEAGEVAEKIKKLMRDGGGQLTPERRDALKKELGDVLWYVAALCSELSLDMGEVAQLNIEKLRDRHERGRLHGDGDNR